MDGRRKRGDSNRSVNEVIRASSQFLGHGLAFALSTLLFLMAGYWADRRLGTGGFLTVVGAFVGASAGFYSMYYHIVIEPRKKADNEE